MCGIHASVSTEDFLLPSQILKHLLCDRGPDHTGDQKVTIEKQGEPCYLSFTSTVLALRGGHVTAQPFFDASSGSLLCWNGEAWKIGPNVVTGNDGQAVFTSLLEAVAKQKSASGAIAAVLQVLNSISGPFAFVFLDRTNEQIFFGRDRLGRRSLLSCTTLNSVEFASTADSSKGIWQEVEADAVFLLSFNHESLNTGGQEASPHNLKSLPPVQQYAWKTCEQYSTTSLGYLNRSIPTGTYPQASLLNSVSELGNYLRESLKPRLLNIPVPPIRGGQPDVRVAVLFSGGLDCTVLARLLHDILPLEYQIDLLNAAFENPRVIQAAKQPPQTKKGSKKTNKLHEAAQEDESEVSISQIGTVSESPYESCPDRETGRKTFEELNKVCTGRLWRFIAIDIPYTETVSHRNNVIDLIYPHNTEMDISIGYALYFAARGSGVATTYDDPVPVQYTTPARVLLSGLGADELFGGYMRHTTAFNRNGFLGLLDELELDVSRLGKRNLGRDDRVISHWAREARFPYLDESVVKWALECPIWEKCGFHLASFPIFEDEHNIEPDKKILRLLAFQLGMHSVAREKKRAIQFGARTAKMEAGKTKGTSTIS